MNMFKSKNHVEAKLAACWLLLGVAMCQAEDYTYTVTDSKATITGYTGPGGNITLPDTLSGYPVVSIGDYAFNQHYNLTSITIPSSVTNIGNNAFEFCGNLTSITIPDSIRSIGKSAFCFCRNLVSIAIPNSIARIEDSTFLGCYKLTNIIIPDSVTHIGDYAFEYCRDLVSITIPDSVTHIGDYAFQYCRDLSGVNIPRNVTNIGCAAFTKSYIPNGISVDQNNQNYSSKDGVLFDRTETTLVAYPYGTSGYEIPNGVTNISNYAFYGCNLTSITIPDGVTSIGDSAFSDCYYLASITIPASVTHIGDYAFSGWSSQTSIDVHEKNQNYSSRDGVLFNKAVTTLITYPNNKSGSYVIPDGVTNISSAAFNSCYYLTSITIPDSVTHIGDYAFYDCSNLAGVAIPDGVTSIGDFAFYYCDSLTSVTLPNSATRIGERAFYYCESLTSITIPDSVTSIGDYAFDGCYQVTNLILSGSITNIGDGAFYSCCHLTSLTIPESVISIGDFAFASCYGLTSLTVSNGVTRIGNGAFSSCSGLTSITLPDSVTNVGDHAFDYCSSLVKVFFDGDAPSTGSDVFSSTPATIYRKSSAASWPAVPELWCGRPTAYWDGSNVATPAFGPDGGEYSGSSVSVTVVCATAEATIHYTVDGGEPTLASATVASCGTVDVPVPGTLKAKAFRDDLPPSTVKSAEYHLLGSFSGWAQARGLEGEPAIIFRQDRNSDGIPNGIEYIFGTNLPSDGRLLKILIIDGRCVVESPMQDDGTLPYANLRVLCSTNMVNWNLPVVPITDTTGKPENRAWFEPASPPAGPMFFKVEAELE
jgi:hypothetical protein